ncbi:alpha/beta hydrolase [Burkholderia sp. FERM BP-3421]|jgi:pimeloyl-ACP methyl ester carboxylesterase|uniref:alpha/beta fold hydrolase n=1 Tax=Burkholderia sp. FERM BP-3421 TaxID=1494466 RepID=UPI00235DEFEB|nr:alpha/beta hydrolase [Burkholderia sp. FERM BP-3421]WDD91635.1 alpha/beta hydrolase [Burkholderia sp. FERM BP-3421]
MLTSPPPTTDHWIATAQGRAFARRWRPSAASAERAPIVLFHDSLGCVALWRAFPAALAQATGRAVIAYDRPGFGASDARRDTLALDFVEAEAAGPFRALRAQLGFDQFIAFGHSVGGGMAVGCAAAFPEACRALVTESAQAFVEARTLAGIRAAERTFAEPGQLDRLARHHGDKAAWVLRAWVDTWCAPGFQAWSLDALLPRVRCPVLAIHGEHDEYGSPRHPERIASRVSGPARVDCLRACGHVPHRDRGGEVLTTVAAFLRDIDA